MSDARTSITPTTTAAVRTARPKRAATSTAGRWTASSATAESAQKGCVDPDNPNCQFGPIDVMGYHTADATSRTTGATRKNFVLQDHMFEPNASWSLPAHLFLVSEWSAKCTRAQRSEQLRERRSRRPGRSRRTNADEAPGRLAGHADLRVDRPHLPAAQAERLVGLLRRDAAPSPTARTTRRSRASPVTQNAKTPGIWNPLPYFDTVSNDDQARQHPVGRRASTRPRRTARSPRSRGSSRRAQVSEHPPSSVSAGQSYVTSLVNAVMNEPRLELDRDLPGVGRLGRLLRPRRAARRRRERLRAARAGHRDQPVRQARLHRPSDPELRRVRQVHRRRLPRRSAPRPQDRRPARPAARRAREQGRSSATSPPTSTSPRRRDRRCCYRSHPVTTLTADGSVLAVHAGRDRRQTDR